MSVSLLRELQEELARLYIAGSDLAVGDFRLKRLAPQLSQLGERAPVFKRLGEGVQELIEPAAGDERSSAARLQELALLLGAVLRTQGETAPSGELRELGGTPVELPTVHSCRKLTEVLDALASTGGGRQEVIKQAFEEGLFQDLRLIMPAIEALNDSYAEIADYIKDRVLPAYGPQVVPLLKARIELSGGRSDARAVEVVGLVGGDAELAYIRQAAGEGSEAVRIAAIGYLAGHEAYEGDLLDWTADGKKAIRAAAYAALAESDSERALARLHEAFSGKDRELVADVLSRLDYSPLTPRLVRDAQELLAEARDAGGATRTEAADAGRERQGAAAGGTGAADAGRERQGAAAGGTGAADAGRERQGAAASSTGAADAGRERQGTVAGGTEAADTGRERQGAVAGGTEAADAGRERQGAAAGGAKPGARPAGGVDKEKLGTIRPRLEAYLDALRYKTGAELDLFYGQVLEEGVFYHGLEWTRMVHDAARHAAGQPDARTLERLLRLERCHASYLPYSFRMSLQLRSPEEIYAHYSGYRKGEYKDTLVQELERALISTVSRVYPKVWGKGEEYGLEVRLPSPEELAGRWDPRWLDWAVQLDAPMVAAVMARAGHRDVASYLAGKFRNNLPLQGETFLVMWEGLGRAGVGEEERREMIVAALEARQKGGMYRFDPELFRQLAQLPAAYRDRLDALRQRYRYDAAAQLQYLIDTMNGVQS